MASCSSSSAASTSTWMQFFCEAGIPEKVAANYAITFAEHRIAMSMLLDLNKEILHDVGVTVIGDVIAVLKHAKVVHERVARDKLLKTRSPVVSVAPVLAGRAKRDTVLTSYNDETVPLSLAAQGPETRKNPPGRIVLKRKATLPPPKVPVVKRTAPIAVRPRVTASSFAAAKPSVFNRLDAVNNEANSVFDRLGPGQTGERVAGGPKVVTVNEAKKRFPTLAQKVARASVTSRATFVVGGPSRETVRGHPTEAPSSGRTTGSSDVFGRLGPKLP